IVSSATASAQREFVSVLACRRRPGRRLCPGTLAIRRGEAADSYIFWACTECGDNGRISGYENTAGDLTAVTTKAEEPRKTAQLAIDPTQYRSWISGDMVSYSSEDLRAIYSAVRVKRGATISVSTDELETLLESVAADVNHEHSVKRRNDLERIYDELCLHESRKKRRAAPASPKRPKRTAASRSQSPVDLSSAYAHGFFSAVVSGPVSMPTAWLQRFLPANNESLDALNAHAQRVMSAHNEVAEQLLERPESFGNVTLRLATSDETGEELIHWQEGFHDAMGLNPAEWTGFLDDPASKDLLSPLGMIAAFVTDPERRDWLTDKTLRENLGRAVGLMTVRIWELYRNAPMTPLEFESAGQIRREPKVPRNAPCPCGSGLKFKRCCGSTLHSV
ncbi:MAG: UPF0149 family protein, partial [Candidatus Tumulicola sp.]